MDFDRAPQNYFANLVFTHAFPPRLKASCALLKFRIQQYRLSHRRGRGAAHGHVTDVVGRLRVVRRSAASRPGWLRQRRVGGAGGKPKTRKNMWELKSGLFVSLCGKFSLR